jgi:hypothetical protein
MQTVVLANSTFLQLRKLSVRISSPKPWLGVILVAEDDVSPSRRQVAGDSLRGRGALLPPPWPVWEVEDRTLPLEDAWHAKD